MSRLGPGGGAADAREQPAPGRRRAPAGPRGLRRDRQGGAQPGRARGDQARADEPERPRDAARAVGQAGGRVRDPPGRAARADRQLQPRARLGELGHVPRARRRRADDVRPDDRGVLDLHRDPGHPPGHLRDVRRDRPPALRRIAARKARGDGRAGRHGRRPAAGGDAQRGLRAVRRGRPAADRAADRDALPRRARGLARRRARPARRRPRRGPRAVDRPARQRRRGAAGAGAARRRGRRGDRPDERPRSAERLHPGRADARAGRGTKGV